MKFNSTYDALKYLVEQKIDFSFSSEVFSHAQGASVHVSENIRQIFDAASVENLEFAIYQFMCGCMADDSLVWLEDFKLSPALDDDGSLVFDVEFYSSGKNFWGTSDPLYQAFIHGFPCDMETLFYDEYSDEPLQLDMLRMFSDVRIVDSNIEKLELRIELADEYRKDFTETELERVNGIISEINKSAVSTLEAGVEELALKVKDSGVSTYSVEFQNENGYLSEGRIEADYSSCYTTQFGDWSFDHLRTDEMVYKGL